MKRIITIFLATGVSFQLSAQNIGIGNNSPLMRLHVSKNDSAVALFENTQALGLNVSTALYFKTGSGGFPYTAAIKTIGESTTSARLGLFTYTSTSPNQLLERMSINDIGKVGIGSTNPQASLHVNPNGAGSILIGTNRSAGGYTNLEMGINAQMNGYGYIQATKASGATYGFLLLNPNGGRVGIATTTPTSALDVHGGISLPIKVVTSSYSVLETDYTIVADMEHDSNKVINIYLPPQFVSPGRIIKVATINMDVQYGHNGYYPDQTKNVVNIYNGGGTILYETLYNRFVQKDYFNETFSGVYLSHRDFRSEKKSTITLQCIAATGWIITDLDSDEDHWGYTH